MKKAACRDAENRAALSASFTSHEVQITHGVPFHQLRQRLDAFSHVRPPKTPARPANALVPFSPFVQQRERRKPRALFQGLWAHLPHDAIGLPHRAREEILTVFWAGYAPKNGLPSGRAPQRQAFCCSFTFLLRRHPTFQAQEAGAHFCGTWKHSGPRPLTP